MNAEAARPGRTVPYDIERFDDERVHRTYDDVVTEEPLELRLLAGGRSRTLAITMRTPGSDFELAAGFVFGERIVRDRSGFSSIGYCIDPSIDAEQRYNIVNVELTSPDLPDASQLERHFTINSSCGVCGRASLDTLLDSGIEPVKDGPRVARAVICEIPNRMREAQRIFAVTGGLHAAALFDDRGTIVAVREDVGRHNAVDKLIGWSLLESRAVSSFGLFVSGRASYDILQKAAVARIGLVCAVSAPSSLAVELARRFNITLVGFVRGTRANVYSNAERIIHERR